MGQEKMYFSIPAGYNQRNAIFSSWVTFQTAYNSFPLFKKKKKKTIEVRKLLEDSSYIESVSCYMKIKELYGGHVSV